MRALFVSLLIPLLAACSAMSPVPPSASPSMSDVDVSGRWTGSWIGTGLFDSPREDSITLDLRQFGYAGYGRMVFEGTTAAESVPWEVRREGLSGIRVGATIDGSEVHVKHEMGGRVFAADFRMLSDDRMIGQVRGAPNVRMLLTRAGHREAPPARALPEAPVTPAPTVSASPDPEPLAKIEAAPEATEPDPVQIAAVMPSEEPQQAPEQPTARPRIEEFIAVPELKVVYFDFDKAALRPEAVDTLTANAGWLKENADTLLLIEGHCDERGTTEYNQALGDRRAQSVKEQLAASGIDPERMTTISYGKEKPVCTENTDECRAQNRRVQFKVKSK
jgi:peptidoglycan-associated lipoprotein